MGVQYDKIYQKNENFIIPGKAPLSKMIDFPTIIIRLTGGHGSIIRKPNGFIYKTDSEIIERDYTGPDPRNETLFLMDMNSSAEHIDRPSKRR